MKASKALYAGSFDPLTNGHLDIIRRASRMCGEVVVGVIINMSKKSMFTFEERMEMIRKATEDLPNVKVDTFSGLLADYVNENGFNVVIRGLRATMDFEYEIQMAQINSKLYKGMETVFLMTDERYSYISSSAVRERGTSAAPRWHRTRCSAR